MDQEEAVARARRLVGELVDQDVPMRHQLNSDRESFWAGCRSDGVEVRVSARAGHVFVELVEWRLFGQDVGPRLLDPSGSEVSQALADVRAFTERQGR